MINRMTDRHRNLREYIAVVHRLAEEFDDVHPMSTVYRCVDAARHGARDVTGQATPEMVERIARKHLQVLALVAAEQRWSPRPQAPQAPPQW